MAEKRKKTEKCDIDLKNVMTGKKNTSWTKENEKESK